MNRQRMITLLQREYWEHRVGFQITPVVLGSALLLLLLMAWVLAMQAGADFLGGSWFVEQHLKEMAHWSDEQIKRQWTAVFLGVDSIFNITLFVVLFFYLLGALSDDRKDRSILFWKSMPVTDTETVLSKLFSAILVAPALMLAAEFLTLLAGIVLYGFWLLFYDVPAWHLSLGSAPIVSHIAANAFNYLVYGLWMLPLYGWLLLASSAARRRPFLLATMPLLALIILENFFSLLSDWSIKDNFITPYIFNRFRDGLVPMQLHVASLEDQMKRVSLKLDDLPSLSTLDLFTRTEMWVGLLLGGLFIAGAIWFRRYREEG